MTIAARPPRFLRRQLAATALVAAACWPLLATNASAETFDEACAMTLKAHPVMRANLAQVKAATEGVTVAQSGYYPQVALNSELNSDSYTRQVGSVGLFGREAGLSASQLLYDGMITPSRVAGAKAEHAAQFADRVGDQNQLLLAVARVYIGVLRDREQVAAAKRNLGYHRDSVKRLEEMTKHDQGKSFDLTQVKAREALATSNLVEREAALRASEAAYREIVGQAPGPLTMPAPPRGPVLKSLEQALATGQADHPAVKAAASRAKGRMAAKGEALGVLSPRVDALARYVKGSDRQSLPGQNDEAYAGVRASYAFPTGLGTVAQARGADMIAESASFKVDAAKRDVREAVRVAWAQREGVAATLPLATEHWKRVTAVLEGFRAQYALGRRNMLEVLIVQEEVYNSESRKIQLTFDKILADYGVAGQAGALAALYAMPEDTPVTPRIYIGGTGDEAGQPAPAAAPAATSDRISREN